MNKWLICVNIQNWHGSCNDVSKLAITGKFNKGKTKMSTETKAQENESRLGVAIALSMAMIFTSYAISVLNHQEDTQANAYTHSQRPAVVSYIA
jgi:hypothetical protein